MPLPPLDPADRSRPRRGFLAQLAAAAAAIATGAAARPLAAALPQTPALAPRDTTLAPRGAWDMSWVDRITAQHRQVFDAPELNDGSALGKTWLYLEGFHEVYGTNDADVNAVIVFRHHAIPAVLGNTLWARYDYLAETTKLKDPTTGGKAKRNPFLDAKPDDKYTLVWKNGGLDSLIQRGVIVLACNMALRGFAGQIAARTNASADTVEEELRHGLVPGVILMPSGIFAVTRAEEAGCHYLSMA